MTRSPMVSRGLAAGLVCISGVMAIGALLALGARRMDAAPLAASVAPNAQSDASASLPDAKRALPHLSSRGATTASVDPTARLTWAPPVLTRPITVQIADSGLAAPSLPDQNPDQPWVVSLDPNRDYVLELHHRKQGDIGGLAIHGGHNVVIIGGEIEVQTMPDDESSRREALVFHDQTGTVHLEGVWVHGQPLRCVVFDSRRAIFQIENVRCDGVYMWNRDFNTAHSDALVTWKSPRVLRFDKYTTDYDNTGLAFYGDGVGGYPQRVILRRVNIRNSATFPSGAAYIYRGSTSTRLDIDRVYAQTGRGRTDTGAWPQLQSSRFTLWDAFDGPDEGAAPRLKKIGTGRRAGSYVIFTKPVLDNVWGPKGLAQIAYGTPPGGDFVLPGDVGVRYASPGYQFGSATKAKHSVTTSRSGTAHD